MRFLIQLIFKITNSNNLQVCPWAWGRYRSIDIYYTRLPFFNLSWGSYSLATASCWSDMLSLLIVKRVSCFRRDCSLFCTWPAISFHLWLWKSTVTVHSGDSVVCRGHTQVYFSISEFCTRLNVTAGVQRGKHHYDASIKQGETIQDFSLSRAILKSSYPIRWIRCLEYL